MMFEKKSDRRYEHLNVWPDTHEKVMALRRTKTHRTGWGEHKMESVDSVLNRLLDFYEEKIQKKSELQ